MKNILSIKNLYVTVQEKTIVQGIDLALQAGSIHALMGPNGSGKSTLAYTLMGHPGYTITQGTVEIAGHDSTNDGPDKRAQAGIFLAFQQPCEIPGVSVMTLLKESYQALYNKPISVAEFKQKVDRYLSLLGLDESFIYRSVHSGFSGGEKKRIEMLQMLVLQPKIAVLDEIDSGLDIDALKIVGQSIAFAKRENPAMAVVLITHYQRILNYVLPDYVHVMASGKIVASGGMEIVHRLETKGYDAYAV